MGYPKDLTLALFYSLEAKFYGDLKSVDRWLIEELSSYIQLLAVYGKYNTHVTHARISKDNNIDNDLYCVRNQSPNHMYCNECASIQ